MAARPVSAPNASKPAAEGPGAFLRLRASTTSELREAVRKCLPFSAVEAVWKHLDVSPQRMTAVLGIPPRTVARRKAARSLTSDESDRLYWVARYAAPLSLKTSGPASRGARPGRHPWALSTLVPVSPPRPTQCCPLRPGAA
jgi:hypothetical protein